MKQLKFRTTRLLSAAIVAMALLISPQAALAHCDTLDGPVVADARTALATGEITGVLKWVHGDDEGEVRSAFARSLAVRKLDPEARALADTYFFETLVRIHRAGEGAPFTGLKAAGTIEPVVAEADKALESGSVDDLVKTIVAHTEEGIRERFAHALETRKHAKESVHAGREYVEAYVSYVHHAEEVARVAHGSAHDADHGLD